uniref:Uncharacterized protein LOC114324264 n=1 Tax=Diabrotica virgifera virgifera TaxID=50390 RepID=A0A6P7EZ51_DIAVI
MFTFTASGGITPPMVVYPYKRLPANIAKSVPGEWGIGLSDTGWMKAELMCDYIENILYPHLKKVNTSFPVILFLDGHRTHMTYNLSILCKKLNIVLICLYPNSTRLVQPADVSAFKPIKSGWKKAVIQWRRDHPSETLSKEHFANVLKIAVEQTGKSETIKRGFKACGLYPWNPNALDYSKCLGGQKILTVESETKSENLSNTFLSYKDFSRIVGNRIIQEFNNDYKDVTENKQPLLFKLWKSFKHILQAREVIPVEQQTLNMPTDSTVHTEEPEPSDFNINEIPVLIVSHDQILDGELDENIQIINVQDMPPEHTGTEQIELSRPNNNENTNEQRPPNLNETLQFAKTPKRKGNRNTEKITYAITSTQWIKRKAEEEESKKKIAAEKEERKRQRLEKKAVTVSKISKKVKSLKTAKKEKTQSRKTEKSINREIKDYDKPKMLNKLTEQPILPEKDSFNTCEDNWLLDKFLSDIPSSSSFQDNKKCDLKNIAIEKVKKSLFTDEVMETYKNNSLFKNPKLTEGLCFSCTYNFKEQNLETCKNNSFKILHKPISKMQQDLVANTERRRQQQEYTNNKGLKEVEEENIYNLIHKISATHNTQSQIYITNSKDLVIESHLRYR